MNAVEESDESLMTRYVEHGDREAFQLLFTRYGGRLQGFFVRGTGNKEVAADLVQTTFLHVHRARQDFDPKRAFRPWMFAIAANARREYWRKRKRRPEEPLDPEYQGSVAPQASTATDRAVRRAVETLPDNQKDVVLLRWYAGLTFPEIAKSLGIQTSAAKVRAHRATKALRALLGGADG